MKPDLSQLSTFQLAHALGWKLKGPFRKMTKTGASSLWLVELEGKSMLATTARRKCEAEIIRRQTEAGLDMMEYPRKNTFSLRYLH
jgi:hypothetical protein